MKDAVLNLINENRLIVGGLYLITGVSYLIYKIGKKESLRMKDHNLLGWKAFVNSWAVIIMLIIGGIFMILQS